MYHNHSSRAFVDFGRGRFERSRFRPVIMTCAPLADTFAVALPRPLLDPCFQAVAFRRVRRGNQFSDIIR